MSDETAAPEAPQATTETPNTPEDAGQQTFDRAYVEKLRQEAAANRVKAKQAQDALEEAKKAAERAKLDEVDRLKAELQDFQTKFEAAQQQVQAERIRADLTGKVTDARLAMAVVGDYTSNNDGEFSVDLDKLFTDYPALKPTEAPRSSISPGNPPGDPREGRPVTPADFAGKTPEEAQRLYKRWQEQNRAGRSGIFSGTKITH